MGDIWLSHPDPDPISDSHTLREMFRHLVAHTFQDTLGWERGDLCVYLANLLTDFAHCDHLYRVRNLQGERLHEVATMLMEADVLGNATSFDQERSVHKHIGDFTLFWTGIYPEALRRMREQGRADHLIDYVRQGKASYYIVSTFQEGRYAEDAPLFRTLSEEFELCLYGLNLVRREWEQVARRPRL